MCGFEGRELENYKPLWFPLAFEDLDCAASGEVAAAVGLDRRANLLGVAAVAVGTCDLDVRDQIGGHSSPVPLCILTPATAQGKNAARITRAPPGEPWACQHASVRVRLALACLLAKRRRNGPRTDAARNLSEWAAAMAGPPMSWKLLRWRDRRHPGHPAAARPAQAERTGLGRLRVPGPRKARSMAELSREEVCAAIRLRLNVGALPKLEGDVFRVYDRVCQRRERLEDVATVFPGMTVDAVQAAWDTLRVWAEKDL